MRRDYFIQMLFWILVGMFIGYLWKGLHLVLRAMFNEWPYDAY
jgi:hypothetical protein